MNDDWQVRNAEMTIHRLIKEEQDAVDSYLGSAEALRESFPQIAKQFEDIASEERAHIGELLALQQVLFPEIQKDVDEGIDEVIEELGDGCGPVQDDDVAMVFVEDALDDLDEGEPMYREVPPLQ